MVKVTPLLRRNKPTRKRPYNPEILFRDNWKDYDFERQELFDQVYGRIEQYSPFSDELFRKYYDENRIVGGGLTTKEFAICKVFLHIDWDELFMIWKNPPLSFLRKFKKVISWEYYFQYCKINEKIIKEFRGWKYKDDLVNNKYFTGDLIDKFKHYYIEKYKVNHTFINEKITKKIVMNNLNNIVPNYLYVILDRFQFNDKEFNRIINSINSNTDVMYCEDIDILINSLNNQSMLSEEYKNKLKMLYELNK